MKRYKHLVEDLNEACWKGYKQVGMKKKGNRMVPNCVPESTINEKDLKYKGKKMKSHLDKAKAKLRDRYGDLSNVDYKKAMKVVGSTAAARLTARGMLKRASGEKKKGKLGKVTCVDKANVFKSQALFRKIFNEIKDDYPNISADTCYVDAMALNLIRQPWEYDVMVMENIFGDILSDLGGGLVGGMGMASCGEIGDNHGLFQPAHGSAPDIMGKNKANPLATILSGSMMLEYLADKNNCPQANEAALMIENAVEEGFNKNLLRPFEFGGDMSTTAITSQILDLIK